MGARVSLLLLLCGPLLLGSAACTRKMAPATERATTERTATKDSSSTNRSYVERVRLTPVEAAADKVPFVTQLEVDATTGKLKPATYTSRGRRATVQLAVDADGKVTGECGCDAEKAVIASFDRTVSNLQSQYQELKSEAQEKVQVNVPVPYTAWYDYIARVLAILLVIGMLALLILYLLHLRKPKATEDA